MKVVCFSDTHGLHRQIKVPKCDLLLFAGDIGLEHINRLSILYDFVDFLNDCPAKEKVAILGNHDRLGEIYSQEVNKIFLEENILLLSDSEIRLFGLNIWGSPYTPEYCNWAFSFSRGKQAERHWSQIPENIDILLTHGQPYGILDNTIYDKEEHIGDSELWNRIAKIKPKLYVGGHLHFSGGKTEHIQWNEFQSTVFVNASSLDEDYKLRPNPIIEIEL
jgi:Icc-related predicted phosphoesterase